VSQSVSVFFPIRSATKISAAQVIERSRKNGWAVGGPLEPPYPYRVNDMLYQLELTKKRKKKKPRTGLIPSIGGGKAVAPALPQQEPEQRPLGPITIIAQLPWR